MVGPLSPEPPGRSVPSAAGAPGPDVPTSAEVARLPRATTFAVVHTAPGPAVPAGPPGGLVVHPRRDMLLRSAPGGNPVAVLPATELGSPTWVPVLVAGDGWSRVLLPSRPNGSSAWLFTDTDTVDLARTDAVVRIDVSARRMAIDRAGRRTGSWPVVVGARATPTPAGTTFLMASVYDPGNSYSTHLLPLGWHSDTLDTFGGGPGTVAIHGWRDGSIFRRPDRALSHGCVRVPAAGLLAARQLPLGTPVVIT